MPRLDFHHQETGRLLAEVQADGVSFIPVVDDRVYAPSADDAGVYSLFRIAGREFYYDQRGVLAHVNLTCVEVSSDGRPPLPSRPRPTESPRLT